MNDGVREKQEGSVPNMPAALLWEENSWGGLALSLSLDIFSWPVLKWTWLCQPLGN